MFQGLIRREPGCEPSTADANDDAIEGRKQGERVADRLVHGREDPGCVQHDVDKGRDYDDEKHSRDHGQDRFLIHDWLPWPPQFLSA